MRDYINTISKERTFISYQGEQLSLEEEKRFVNPQIKRIREGKCVVLLVFSEDKLVGVANLDLGKRTSKHIANLGISLAKDLRDQGIGFKLLETVINEGKKNLKGIEIIKLTVFSNNARAISLYKKFSFEEYGRLPNGVKLENGYDDQVKMYKSLKPN
jgi:ribosomal protein S18 acetylase RimI-like enzyme